MIWFNLKKLERKIIKNEFSDEEGFKYFLGTSIIWFLGPFIGVAESPIDYIELPIGLGITIWGSYSIFKVNASGDGKDFFKRFFALSWVIGIKLLVIGLIILVPLIVLGIMLGDIDYAEESVLTLTEEFFVITFSLLFLIVYYLLLIKSFRCVSQNDKR
ncbi:hypothetical protein RCC89_05540 [Cytophagaceae bacterium ABcell3]|nr:hypothetical protein RCC89_05540 [Cytophagaceae bacterium ABcell3]